MKNKKTTDEKEKLLHCTQSHEGLKRNRSYSPVDEICREKNALYPWDQRLFRVCDVQDVIEACSTLYVRLNNLIDDMWMCEKEHDHQSLKQILSDIRLSFPDTEGKGIVRGDWRFRRARIDIDELLLGLERLSFPQQNFALKKNHVAFEEELHCRLHLLVYSLQSIFSAKVINLDDDKASMWDRAMNYSDHRRDNMFDGFSDHDYRNCLLADAAGLSDAVFFYARSIVKNVLDHFRISGEYGSEKMRKQMKEHKSRSVQLAAVILNNAGWFSRAGSWGGIESQRFWIWLNALLDAFTLKDTPTDAEIAYAEKKLKDTCTFWDINDLLMRDRRSSITKSHE